MPIWKKYIEAAIADLNFKSLTDVQRIVWQNIEDNNKNLIITSKTGSGKTHSFLLPIFQHLNEDEHNVFAVIIAPTAELVGQITKMARHIASFCDKEIVIKSYTQQTDMLREIAKIKTNPPQIVIATPGKAVDLTINENILKIHEASYFVIDEVDMIAHSFLEDILALTTKMQNARFLLFSATINDNYEVLLKKYLSNEVVIHVDEKQSPSLQIEHFLIHLKNKPKEEMLELILKNINPYLAIIFVNKKENIPQVYQKVKALGYESIMIHGDLQLRERKRIMKEINALKYQYIISSDIISRGIDIDGISHIINYDLPYDYEFYIHRSGRCGRMHYEGVCYSICEYEDQKYLDALKTKGINFKTLVIKDDGFEEVIPRVRNTFNQEKADAHKKLGKPTRVSPNYKKKRAEKVQKMLKDNKQKRSR